MARQSNRRPSKKRSAKSNQMAGRLPRNAPPIEVTISHIGGRGDGIAKALYTHNYSDAEHDVFVPASLPGERLLVQPLSLTTQGIKARIIELYTPSPDRHTPRCDPLGRRDRGGSGPVLPRLGFEATLAIVIEIVVVVLVIAALVAFVLLPIAVLVFGGAALVVLGLGVGVPAGIAYHVRLHRILSEKGVLDRYWWVNPTGRHKHLDQAEMRSFARPFFIGAAGWGVAVLGTLVTAVGLFRYAILHT